MDQIKKITKIFNDENSFAIPICFGIMVNASQDDESLEMCVIIPSSMAEVEKRFIHVFIDERIAFIYAFWHVCCRVHLISWCKTVWAETYLPIAILRKF